jgi:hypothetical protein
LSWLDIMRQAAGCVDEAGFRRRPHSLIAQQNRRERQQDQERYEDNSPKQVLAHVDHPGGFALLMSPAVDGTWAAEEWHHDKAWPNECSN